MKNEKEITKLMIYNPSPSELEDFFNGNEKYTLSSSKDDTIENSNDRICDMCDSEFEMPANPGGFPNAINIYTDSIEDVSTGFTMDICPSCMRLIFSTIGLGRSK